MKNNIYTILKKELMRFFKDKRLVITTIFLPGIMIYIMYTFMGSMISKQVNVASAYKAEVYGDNVPSSLKASITALNLTLKQLKDFDKEKSLIENKKSDALLIFPKDFDEKVAEYKTGEGQAPEVMIYYNSSRKESRAVYQEIKGLLDNYENSISNKFDINRDKNKKYDLAEDKDITGKMLGGFLPMLLIMFIWSGCMAVAPEAIAGEKERGTIATLLVTPVKRSHLAFGKISALSIIALLSGTSSFIGTFTSLPNMYKGIQGAVNISVYGAKELLYLFLIIMTTTLLVVAVISVLSAFAKNIKEAATIISPLMIVIMILTLLPSFSDIEKTPIYLCLIPFYNNILCLHDIFTFTYSGMNVLISAIVNIITTVIMVIVLTRMFNSEKIMFSK